MKFLAEFAIRFPIMVSVFCLSSSLLFAQSEDEAEPIPQSELEKPPAINTELEHPPPLDPDLEAPPPLPPKIQDEQIQPTVTIREEEDRIIEEYSYNGQVYMVKVTPQVGEPYYYMDLDGDGSLERDERSRAFQPVEPAQWKIKEWK